MNNAEQPTEIIYFTEHGSGSPLLLIHGSLVTGKMFQSVISYFAQRHRVIVPDLRGHGHSRSLPPPYTTEQHAADLAKLLDILEIKDCSILGYSHGGAVAQQFALDCPQHCGHLILAGTYAHNPLSIREKIEGVITTILLRMLGIKRFAKYVLALGLKEVPKQISDQLINMVSSQDNAIMQIDWHEVMTFDSRKRLGEIKCPTLVIAGSKDTGVPTYHAKMLHEGIRGSKLVIIEGGSHTLVWSQPQKLAKIVDEFLSG